LTVLEQWPFDLFVGRGDILKYDLWNSTTRMAPIDEGSLPSTVLEDVASNATVPETVVLDGGESMI